MGFFEILIVAVVTLLVVGPERMPEAVRSVALTVGRIKRAFQSARSEIEEHIGADEIRRQLHNEEIMANVEVARENMESTMQENPQIENQTDQHDLPATPLSEPAAADSAKSYTADSSS